MTHAPFLSLPFLSSLPFHSPRIGESVISKIEPPVPQHTLGLSFFPNRCERNLRNHPHISTPCTILSPIPGPHLVFLVIQVNNYQFVTSTTGDVKFRVVRSSGIVLSTPSTRHLFNQMFNSPFFSFLTHLLIRPLPPSLLPSSTVTSSFFHCHFFLLPPSLLPSSTIISSNTLYGLTSSLNTLYGLT